MQDLLNRITANVAIDEGLAATSVAIILNFLKDASPDVVEQVVARMPGYDDLLAQAPPASGGGILGRLGGLLGGGMGGAMAAFTMLTDAGLEMGQVQGVIREVIVYAREQAGDRLVDEVVGSIPGLAQFAGEQGEAGRTDTPSGG